MIVCNISPYTIQSSGNSVLALFSKLWATWVVSPFINRGLLQAVTSQGKFLTAPLVPWEEPALLAIPSPYCFMCSEFSHQILGNGKKTRFCVEKLYTFSVPNQSPTAGDTQADKYEM